MRLLLLFVFIVPFSCIQTTLRKRERFLEWLKYDAECRFLPRAEQEIRSAQGRCPPPESTTVSPVTVRTTRKRSFWLQRKKLTKAEKLARTKEKLLSIFSAGGQSAFEIDLNANYEEYTVTTGARLIVTCDLTTHGAYNETDEITWFVNTNPIEVGVLDWRVIIGEKQELIIWPIQSDDEGQFECQVNGIPKASGIVIVVTQQDALLTGLQNYCIVAAFYIPLLCIIIFCIQTSYTSSERVTKEDRMTAFLEEQIMESRLAMKENIAKIVHGEEFEKRKKAVEQSVYSKVGVDGTKLRGNKDTIMTILAPPEESPTAIRVNGRQQRDIPVPLSSCDPFQNVSKNSSNLQKMKTSSFITPRAIFKSDCSSV